MPLFADTLLEKVATTSLRLNPHVLDVMHRIKTAGLHRTAASLHGHSEPLSIKTAAGILGARLVLNSRRRTKIASGLEALAKLASNG